MRFAFVIWNYWALETKNKKNLEVLSSLIQTVVKNSKVNTPHIFSAFVSTVLGVPLEQGMLKAPSALWVLREVRLKLLQGKASNHTTSQGIKGSTSSLKRHVYCKMSPSFRKINVYILEHMLDEASLQARCGPMAVLWGWGNMTFPARKYKNSAASDQHARCISNWYKTQRITLSLFNSIYALTSMYFYLLSTMYFSLNLCVAGGGWGEKFLSP